MKINKTMAIAIALLVSLVSPNVLDAQEIQKSLATERRISAFSLVCDAYRGRFEDLGIPSYARLDQAYRGRQVSARDLVEAAVKANQLSPLTLQDKRYIKAVDTNLRGLVTR